MFNFVRKAEYTEDLKIAFLNQFEYEEEQKDFDSFLEDWEKDLLKDWNKILKSHDIEILNKGNEYIPISSAGKRKFVR